MHSLELDDMNTKLLPNFSHQVHHLLHVLGDAVVDARSAVDQLLRQILDHLLKSGCVDVLR